MAKRKQERTTERKEQRPGVALETAVARVQQMMDRNSVVTHDEKLTDRVGNTRQYDVVIRGTFGGKPMLGVIECRDHKRKKGPTDVEAFAKKTENLGANFRMMVSKQGFTPQALNLARHEFISCMSLLPDAPEHGFMVGQFWYGLIRRWSEVRLSIRFPSPAPDIGKWSYDALLWQKKPIVNWFLNELFTTYHNIEPGSYYLSLAFPTGTSIELNGADYVITELGCYGTLIVKQKRKWISWTGDAYFDWQKNAIEIPGGVSLISTAVETDMSAWDDYEGEMPRAPTGKEVVLLALGGQSLPEDAPIPDLTSLRPNATMRRLPS